jgi:hypothetical protein
LAARCAAEDAAGAFQPLFDGKSLSGWVSGDGKPAQEGKGWAVADGVLHRKERGGDLFTEKEYGDFELEWEWKISEGGNSGVKYRVTAYGKSLLGPEYQMLDDARHADGKLNTHRTACIYDLFPAAADKNVKPVGEWNASRIVVRGGKFEHWLNGAKVAECDTASQAWKDAVARSKFKNQKEWALNPKGKIMLQDHGDQVWFRSIRIRELSAAK